MGLHPQPALERVCATKPSRGLLVLTLVLRVTQSPKEGGTDICMTLPTRRCLTAEQNLAMAKTSHPQGLQVTVHPPNRIL